MPSERGTATAARSVTIGCGQGASWSSQVSCPSSSLRSTQLDRPLLSSSAIRSRWTSIRSCTTPIFALVGRLGSRCGGAGDLARLHCLHRKGLRTLVRLMLRWIVRLDCGHRVDVLTKGDDPTTGCEDNWWCRTCEACQSVAEVKREQWEIAPALKLRDVL
jgi:hypothetical protein